MTRRIFVAGDPAMDDYLLFLPPRRKSGANDWERHSAFVLAEAAGGLHLTVEGVSALCGEPVEPGGRIEVVAIPPVAGDTSRTLHSMVELVRVAEDGRKLKAGAMLGERTFHTRIARYRGYAMRSRPPLEPDAPSATADPSGPTSSSPGPSDIVVLNDAGAGLRKDAAFAGRLAKAGLVIHKRHKALGREDPLRTALAAIDRDRCILHVGARDLRRSGVRLSAQLSWSAALQDLVAAAEPGRFLQEELAQYGTILIQFGPVGAAMVWKEDGLIRCSLVFDPALSEGDFARHRKRHGQMFGEMNAFLCGLVGALDARGEGEGPLVVSPPDVLNALAAARRWSAGVFTIEDRGEGPPSLKTPPFVRYGDPDPQNAHEKKARGEDRDVLQVRTLPLTTSGIADFVIPVGRTIRDRTITSRRDLARAIVLYGKDVIETLPHATFGKFTTIDPQEIAAYRQIDAAIQAYLQDPSRDTPLSLAVFGAPGSGKSFGIKQIVADLDVEILEFNLSEVRADDLPGYFQELRDRREEGRVPLCFLDEFDRNGFELVARFLAPMQDGSFRDKGRTHPLGRAILVFAGGVSSTLTGFRDGTALPDGVTPADLKVPDFLSRLDGVLEIKGLGPPDDGDVVLRRAVILRSVLERKARQATIDSNESVTIDPGLLDALLNVAEFRSGARSLEKIVTMSSLTGAARGWNVSDLPSRDLLDLHILRADEVLDHVAMFPTR